MCQHLLRPFLCLLASTSIARLSMLTKMLLASKQSRCDIFDMVKTKSDYAAEFARRGGKARAKKLTKEQREEIARTGGLAKAKKAKQAKQKKAKP